MADNPLPDDRVQRLTLVQQLWRELHASRKDPVKYRMIAKRIRRESDLICLRDYRHKSES